LILILLAIT